MSENRTVIMKILRRMVWAVYWWIEHILQMLFFLPIKKNRVLFSANDGFQYCCNPKYVSEYLLDHGVDVEIIWGFFHPKVYADIPGIKAVRIHSIAWFYYTVTSSVILTNTDLPRSQPKRKGQLIIETWHGGGAYKSEGTNKRHNSSATLESRIRGEYIRKLDLFVSSSRVFTETTIRKSFGYEGEVLCCGMPRNDLFFDEKRKTETSERIRNMFGITGYLVLYAPTFRGKFWLGYHSVDSFPYRKVLAALERRFGEPATILKRAHPGSRMAGDGEEGVIDVTDYGDFQELLCAADMLITDYSSSIWDFSLLERPCLLYMPDLKEYIAERGVSSSVEEWPGIVCRSDTELCERILALNEQDCVRRAKGHLQALGSYETGTAASQVCERILQHIGTAGNC